MMKKFRGRNSARIFVYQIKNWAACYELNMSVHHKSRRSLISLRAKPPHFYATYNNLFPGGVYDILDRTVLDIPFYAWVNICFLFFNSFLIGGALTEELVFNSLLIFFPFHKIVTLFWMSFSAAVCQSFSRRTTVLPYHWSLAVDGSSDFFSFDKRSKYSHHRIKHYQREIESFINFACAKLNFLS